MPRSEPLRVLHLRDSPWIDGPARTILETAAHVDPTRVDFHMGVMVSQAAQGHPLVDAARTRGLTVHAIPDRPGVDKRVVDDIVALLDRHRIDILHTSEFRSNVLSLLCRRRRRLRAVTTVHGWIANDLRGKAYRFVDKVLLRSFDAVIVVSAATRRLVPRWWLPDSRTHVLHNALVLESYGAGALSRPRRRTDVSGEVNLTNIGRLSAEKGQALLLEAVAPLMASHDLRLTFAGIGPLEDDLRRRADELGIADNVRFRGYVQDMETLYTETDLVIQSSLTEGLPNVVLEAAYLKVPLLATRVGGTGEVVEHGISGWLVRPGVVADLRDGIRRFLEAPESFASMAEAAHARIRERFSFAARTDALTKIYERL